METTKKFHLLQAFLLVLCASCDHAGLAGDTGASSITFHITNTTTQTLYVDTTGNEGVSGFDIGSSPGCGCTCGQCSACVYCTPASSSVRGIGPGESFDVVRSGQVWIWGSGCGPSGCASPAASAKGLTAVVSYSSSYKGLGASPRNAASEPLGELSGTLESPTSTAHATFDYPQLNIVSIELR
jgi:hypothetical protein